MTMVLLIFFLLCQKSACSISLTFGLFLLLMVILVITTTAYAKKKGIITEENDAYGMHERVQTGGTKCNI